MTEVFAFEDCPLRTRAHAVADRSALVRRIAGALWPAARRAERVELTDAGISAWTLVGKHEVRWDELTGATARRTLLGWRVLRIEGANGRL